jgi:eukaryotic-like serine/threonine-protein kinase
VPYNAFDSPMNPEVMTLFRQVADLPAAERADHYARRQVPDALREEVESLLKFDWTRDSGREGNDPAAGLVPDVTAAPSGGTLSQRTVAPPARIGRFEIERLIGRGGMGEVYLARDPVIDRPVAIKLIGSAIENETARRRLVREARTAGRLRHPNIVTIFEAGEHEQQPYIAMEFVPGETLRSLIGRREPLALRRRLEMIEGACAGLAHAHRSGVVHLDIKPDNLILDDTGVVKVLDFGIARNTQADTLTAHVAGTLRYMSPEQIQGRPVDHRSDTFSLGCALFELVVYEAAFTGSTSEIVTRIAQGPVPTLAERVTGVNPELDRIVSRAMALDLEERYADLDELREELASVRLAIDPAADLPVAPRARPGSAERPASRAPYSSRPVPRRRRAPLIAAGIGAVVVAGVVLSFQGGVLAPEPDARDVGTPAAPPAAAPPAAVATPAPSPTDEVWRLLARGERAAVLARLGASSDATLGRAVVDTVRATVLRAREAAAAGAATDTYRNGDEQLTRATRFASNGRVADALRALWQAGDLYAKTSPVAPVTAAPPTQQAGPVASPTAAPPAATTPPPTPAQEVTATSPPAATVNPPPVTAPPPERPATATAAPAAVPSETQAVLEALRRYDAAYEAMDVSALLRVFPSFGQQQTETLRRTFEGVTRYESDTRATRVDVAADTATVQATVARRMSTRVGAQQVANEVAYEFRLRRAGGDWLIVSATPR